MTMNDEDGFVLTLAGKAVPFASLTLRQAKRIVPKMMALRGLAGGSLSEADLDQIIAIVAAAGGRAEPAFGEAELLDMAVSPRELIAAIPVIARACGIEMKGAESGGGDGPLAPGRGGAAAAGSSISIN